MIQQDRLARTFADLVRIDSPSRQEGRMCQELRRIFEGMGAATVVDGAGEAVGGESGNLVVRFPGGVDGPPLMLNAHMDTVEPGRGIQPVLADGVFHSDGTTILGADDKSAIAILIESLRALQESGLPHTPVEVVVTVCEEIGLMGAKHLDFSLITARYGYALDTTDTRAIIVRAPTANRIEIELFGRDAHAGAAPENGINAIHLAAKALADLQIGRIDAETTCNIGTIQGGTATNIVPNRVLLKGEARSHDPAKLEAVTKTIVDRFETVVAAHRATSEDGLPRVEVRVEKDFPHTRIPEDHPVVVLAKRAAENLGREIVPRMTGGGADANIFFEKGIVTGVLGTGMRDMHTVRESIALTDMVYMAELVAEIVRLHSEQYLDKKNAES